MVSCPPLRVVFFGTPDFAVPTLLALLRSRHAVVGVVTQPDRPRGRGHHVSDAPVKARAVAAGLTVLQPAALRDPAFAAAFESLAADIGVVAAYGKMLPESLLRTPRLGMVNVHASLLPRYRGAAPVHRAVIAGERYTGVTIMRVVKALDAGPVLSTATRAIDRDETSEDVERDLALLGSDLLVSVVDRLAAGDIAAEPQDDGAATYAHRLTKNDGLVNWSAPANRIHDLIRGLHPWPHAFTFLDSHRYILHRSSEEPATSIRATPGTVVEATGERLSVATGEGHLAILMIQAEGKRPMTPREFLAGHRLVPGDRFSAP